MYLSGIETVFNREERNDDGVAHASGLTVFSQKVRPFGPIRNASDVSQKERDMAQWFVLHNSPEIDSYLEYVGHYIFENVLHTSILSYIVLITYSVRREHKNLLQMQNEHDVTIKHQ